MDTKNFHQKLNAKNLKIPILLITLITGITLLSGCAKQETDSSLNNTQKINRPYLEMEFLEFPKTIDSLCETVIFKLKAKNIGLSSLSYQDITNNKYSFALHTPDYATTFAYTGETFSEEFKIDNFGVIKPRQEKTLIFRFPAVTYEAGTESERRYNIFNHFDFEEKIREKKEAKLSILLERTEDNTIHSNEPTIIVGVDIWRTYQIYYGGKMEDSIEVENCDL